MIIGNSKSYWDYKGKTLANGRISHNLENREIKHDYGHKIKIYKVPIDKEMLACHGELVREYNTI